MLLLDGGGQVAHEEVQVNSLVLIQRTVKGHVPSQVGFRVLNGFDIVVRLLSSASAKVREQAAYTIGAACAGQRRMQQAASKAKGCTIFTGETSSRAHYFQFASAIKALSPLLHAREDLKCRLAACSALGQLILQDQTNQEKIRKQKDVVESLVGMLCCSPTTLA